MIKLIIGHKGSGKTKQLIELINEAQTHTTGNVVCIEKGMKLEFELNHHVRLIDAEEYKLYNYEAFYGFIGGLLAGNYDNTDIFVDGILKIGNKDLVGLGDLLAKIDLLISQDVNVVFTVSADLCDLPDAVKKYI